MNPRSRYAVPGLYFYDGRVVDIVRGAAARAAAANWRSPQVNEAYLRRGELHVTLLDRGTAWLDTGTFAALVQASEFAA